MIKSSFAERTRGVSTALATDPAAGQPFAAGHRPERAVTQQAAIGPVHQISPWLRQRPANEYDELLLAITASVCRSCGAELKVEPHPVTQRDARDLAAGRVAGRVGEGVALDRSHPKAEPLKEAQVVDIGRGRCHPHRDHPFGGLTNPAPSCACRPPAGPGTGQVRR